VHFTHNWKFTSFLVPFPLLGQKKCFFNADYIFYHHNNFSEKTTFKEFALKNLFLLEFLKIYQF